MSIESVIDRTHSKAHLGIEPASQEHRPEGKRLRQAIEPARQATGRRPDRPRRPDEIVLSPIGQRHSTQAPHQSAHPGVTTHEAKPTECQNGQDQGPRSLEHKSALIWRQRGKTLEQGDDMHG
jgi:hypothetical protein